MSRKRRGTWVTLNSIRNEMPKLVPLTPEQDFLSNIHGRLNSFTPVDDGRVLQLEISYTDINQRNMTGKLGYLPQTINDLFAPLGVTFTFDPAANKVQILNNPETPHKIVARIDSHAREGFTLNIRIDEQTFMELCAAWDHDPKSKLTHDGLSQWNAIKATTPHYTPPEKNTPAR